MAKIMPAQMRRAHQLLTLLGKMGYKHTYVWEVSGNRTESIRDIDVMEANRLIRRLEVELGEDTYPLDVKGDALRKALIAQFRSIGKTVDDAKAWAEKYGVMGNKKTFNSYSNKELFILVQNSKKMVDSFNKSIRKSILI